MTAWLVTPATNLFCLAVRPTDDAPCARLTHTDVGHVAGDGGDWTDTTTEETP